ncbi:MAG: tRNA pseudouridine(38-40) synthase TruA [Pseudomonadota bacterium]
MTRYRLELEYDGTPFVGWQRQDNGPSVQQVLEEAGEALSGDKASSVAAGRTDAGVHARRMTVHIDLSGEFTPDTVRDALNFHMKPAPVSITDASLAPKGFHARFSASDRAYEYLLVDRRAPLALDMNRAWRIPTKLDVEGMHKAAQALVGKHDFTTFRASKCQSNSPVKTLSEITVERLPKHVRVFVRAPSFLHHQVRSIVGSLVEVGTGHWAGDDLAAALAQKDRTRCGQVAPACGLYFLWAEY